MCGISGAFKFDDNAGPIDISVIDRLNEYQRRRGPDGKGIWASPDNRVSLGHRRLAVIDTSEAGIQPMSDDTGRWTVTFNGEIYNYRELRHELEHLGCRFRTQSDTEVLINAIARWGEVGLLKLRGMYAFALWDNRENELWLVRDPYGIKPLYLAERGGTIWFASQARALATCAPIDTSPSPAAVVGFYLWGYVPEPHAWWSGVRPLPAGHVMRIRAGRPLPASAEYASIQDCYINRPNRPLQPPQLRQALQESVHRHLVADVPIGLFLSAGVDSTVLAALSTELGARIRTITLAFDEYVGTADDETPLAEATARLLKTDHTTIRINHDQFEELLHEFLSAMDQPTTDGLNIYLVSRAAASQGLKVVLSGLGGDELFGGYPSFRQIPTLLRWRRRIPAGVAMGQVFQKLLRVAAPSMIPPKSGGVLALSGSVPQAYFLRRALYLDYELDRVLEPALLREGLEQLSTVAAVGKAVELLTEAKATDYAKVAALESGWYMRNQLLRDADWAGMAHGLEVRAPYVDMTLLRSLGPAIASDAPPTKQNLLACCDMPPAIAKRAKTGFTTPVRRWIGQTTGVATRGMRGWAAYVDRQYRGAREAGKAAGVKVPSASVA